MLKLNRWIRWTLVLAVVALGTSVWGATAKTTRDLIRKYGSEAALNLTAVPRDMQSMGRVFYVDSAATNAQDADDGTHGDKWDTPYATVDYAVGRCTASKGDVILVAPTHTETIASATGFVLDTAGVWVIGQGVGERRPTFSMSVAASICYLDADDTGIFNLRFVNTAAAVTLAKFVITSGDDTIVEGCEFVQGAHASDANGTSVIVIGVADGDSDRAQILNNTIYTPTDGWSSGIAFAKDMVGVVIKGNHIWGDYGDAAIEIPTAGNAQVALVVEDNILTNIDADEHAIEAVNAGNTGVIRNNVFHCNGTNVVDAGGLALAGNITKQYATDSNVDGLVLVLAADGITAAEIATDSIGATEIASAAIGADEIATNAIGAAEIADAAIDWATFAADAKNGLEDDIQATMDANSLLVNWTAARAAIVTDLGGISEIGDKVQADMDANSVPLAILTDLGGISEVGDKIVADMDANSTKLAILTDLGGISEVGDKVQADMDANSLLYWMPHVSTASVDEVTADLFTVAGGAIQILQLYGHVDVVIGAAVTTCKIWVDSTAGAESDYDFSTAVAITDDAVGTLYVFSVANPAVLTPITGGTANGAGNVQLPWYCPIGVVEQEMSADPGGAAGDHITWTMVWRPLAAGVTVTPGT